MANFLHDNDDLQYYLNEAIDWETVASLSEHGFGQADGFKSVAEAVTFYKEVATLVGGFVADDVAPHAAEIDREGVRFESGEASFPPRLESIFRKIAALGLHGMTLPRELGGMNAPMLLYFINGELFARADVSVMSHYGFHSGMAMAMLVLSILEGSTELDPATGAILRTRWPQEIAEIASGQAWGSMDITEPNAGSDMAALRAVGEQEPGGGWTVSGQKIFITSGHGKYHFVVARTETASGPTDPKAGLGGLSMFLVRAYRDQPGGGRVRLASVDRIEEKLGHHGSATAALTFDRTPAELVGKRGDGFRQMLELMNNARLAVGFESVGLCEAALRMARAYAAERQSMGKTIDRHEIIADYLDEMETDILGLRALAMHAGFHEEVGQKKAILARAHGGDGGSGHDSGQHSNGASNGVGSGNGLGNGAANTKDLEREIRAHRAVSRRLTPLLKYVAAEKAVEMARRCLQIHGGVGYMREYGAEKLLRDALVMPIYEGTSQVQALMATKDTLTGILKAPQEWVKRLAQARWRALSSRDGLERRVARLQQLSLAAQQHLITRTMAAKVRTVQDQPITSWPNAFFKQWNPRRDFALALLHAERLTRLLADEAIAEILLGQARRHPQRRAVLERYLDRAEPRARFLHDEITSTGQRLLGLLAARESARERGADGQPQRAGGDSPEREQPHAGGAASQVAG
jgi:alkylation response protein AidB-like acyl-CoA dehydrogenase